MRPSFSIASHEHLSTLAIGSCRCGIMCDTNGMVR
jgi:hypothetical protein